MKKRGLCIALCLCLLTGALPALAQDGGALRVLKYYVPKTTYNIPIAFFDMLPFLFTALVLVISSMRKKKGNQIPAHLGVNYYREER